MIVNINKSNADKYHELFREAYTFLKNIDDGNYVDQNGQTFNNLAEYYGHMGDFIAQGLAGYKYIMLPLDEDPFKIDLNTRTIEVPAAFSKCASVQSDQIAETIMFVADRYFDYMDLATTNIYVQWVRPEDKKNNIEEYKGATLIDVVDLESEPGKIKFAWPLNDTITAVPGVVKFSVRFCRVNGPDVNDLFYNLNTLESSIVIKPALSSTIDMSKIENPTGDDTFLRAVINSNYASEGVIPPTMAEFSEPGSQIISSNGIDIVDGKRVTHLDNNDTVTLYAQAYTSDANSEVDYEWYYKGANDKTYYLCSNYPVSSSFDANGNLLDVNNNILTDKTQPIKDAIVFAESAEEYRICDPQPKEKVAREIYYYYDANDINKTNPIEWINGTIELDDNDTPIIKNADKEVVTLYEKYTALTIPETGTITGSYKVAAWGKTLRSGKTPLRTPYPKCSEECIIPIPNAIKFDNNLNANETLQNNLELKVVITEDDYHPELSYQWRTSKVSNNKDTMVAIENATNAEYSPVEPGWYSVAVNASLNRTPISETSEVCRVSYPVEPPIVTSLPVNNNEIYIGNNNEGVNNPNDGYTTSTHTQRAILRVTADVVKKPFYERVVVENDDFVANKFFVLMGDEYISATEYDSEQTYYQLVEQSADLYSDSFEYIWQMQKNRVYVDVTNTTPGVLFDKEHPNQITVTPALKDQYNVFRCLVKNTLNGQSAVFDHSGVGGVNSILGKFELNTEGAPIAPYVYDTNTKNFAFTVIKE